MADEKIQLPKELVPAQVGGMVTEAQYIRDGEETQHNINAKKVDDVLPEQDGIYVRKNGVWSRLQIYIQSDTLFINTGEI